MRFRRHFFSRVARAVRPLYLSNGLTVIFIMRKMDGHFRGGMSEQCCRVCRLYPQSAKCRLKQERDAIYKGFRRHFYDANQALGFNAAASLARRVMVSQSLFFTASFGVSHEPPTHKTLGSAKYSGAVARLMPPVGQKRTSA